MSAQRIVVAGLLVALALAAALDLAKLRDGVHMVDLAAFYCAGERVAQRRDPYASQALAPCERRLNAGNANPAYAIPAPLPPYVFAPFALLSRFDFGFAKALTSLLIVAAGVVAALALADVGIPFFAALAALALSAIAVALFLGQIYPFTIALLALAALALVRRREALAGIAGALSLITPQIGIPICLSLLLWVSRARPALVLTGCALALVGVLSVGPAAFFEWATQVLPSQARFEASFWGQYSLTALLTRAGVLPGMAIALGTLSFVLMLALSLWLAKRLAEKRNQPAYLVALPPALCLLGGAYVHLAAMAAAIPLALLFAQADANDKRSYAVVPLLLLSIPWPLAQAMKALFFSSLFVVVVQLVCLRVDVRRSLVLGSAAAALLYLIALQTPPPLPTSTPFPPSADPLRFVAKLPTWAALIGLLAMSLRAGAFDRRKAA